MSRSEMAMGSIFYLKMEDVWRTELDRNMNMSVDLVAIQIFLLGGVEKLEFSPKIAFAKGISTTMIFDDINIR